MRRVRRFAVCLESSQTKEAQVIRGWHHACDTIAAMLRSGVEVTVHDSRKSGLVVAKFSSQPLTANEEPLGLVRQQTLWRAEPFTCREGSTAWYLNLNLSDFYWGWVSGATREVPFRMNYFERHALHSPHGVCAFCLSLLAQLRDR